MLRSATLLALCLAATARAQPARVEFVTRGDVSAASLAALRAEAGAACERAGRWLGIDAAGTVLRCEVFPTLEAKGLATTYTLPTHAFPDRGEIVCSAEPGFEGELARETALALIHRALGRARHDLLEEGLAVACAENWRREGSRHWAARLSRCDDAGDLEHWLDNRSFRAESPLVRRAIAGEFASWLVATRGAREVVASYATWSPRGEERAALARQWRAHVRELARATPSRAPWDRPLPDFQRGFCHAHEGYAIRDGYLSAQSDRALLRLRELGVNAVSITPFSFMRSPSRAARLPFSSGAGSENDESVIHACLSARGAGLAVMLKPHIWVGGSWPGAIEFATDAEWNAFFAHYERWIRHYALMAQMYDVDLFCAGVELARATVGREERWEAMVARLRTIYGGPVTYAANWGEEFEKVTFWRAFDFAGIDCYYPLDPDEDASDAELSAGARTVLDRIEQVAAAHDRRVIIAEVGFASARAPWRSPHDEDDSAGTDPDAQARCYEAFLREVPGRRRIAGLYWWKWPSDLDEGGPAHAGFTPNGKPAERVVKRWYLGPLSK
jgi:hypothetical protein